MDDDDKPKKKRQVAYISKADLIKYQEANSRYFNESQGFEFLANNRNEHSTEQLVSYLAAAKEDTKVLLPKEKRRYAIYLRKSTETEDKQVRSIKDQEKACLKVATDILKVTVHKEDIFKEEKSAKESGKRDVFNQLLRDFRSHKYQGLIAYSPDRLSRNMKEAGEIIEMVDFEDIQDLAFSTYHFDNSPNGKMMLGILFATSKQYSDNLSVNVKRGNDGNIQEGRYNGILKKGYYVDENSGQFIPDTYNWNLVRQAVHMRLYKNQSNVQIASFLKEAKLTVRKTQKDKFELVKITKAMVGKMFEDVFYCGIYSYGKNVVNLQDIYNFKPLMTPDEYIMLNNKVAEDFNKATGVKSSRPQRLEYGLLRKKVICEYCNEAMQFQHQEIKKGKNSGKWLISFYCRNKECLRHNKTQQDRLGVSIPKSIRAKYVMAAIEWQLRHLTKRSEEAYKLYINRLEASLAADRAVLKRKLLDAKKLLENYQIEYGRYQHLQLNDLEQYNKFHKGKLEEYEELILSIRDTISDNNIQWSDLEAKLPSEEEFYELTRTHLLDFLKADDITVIDKICNEFVSNLVAGKDSVSVIKLNPPYNLMVDLDKVRLGWG